MKSVYGYSEGNQIMARIEYFIALKMTSGMNHVRSWG